MENGEYYFNDFGSKFLTKKTENNGNLGFSEVIEYESSFNFGANLKVLDENRLALNCKGTKIMILNLKTFHNIVIDLTLYEENGQKETVTFP